jgi:hypothetical protein
MVGVNKDALRRICADLGLPSGDAYTQDWAYELKEDYRNEAAFDRYLAAYSTASYGDAERLLLVQLTLDIANDLLGQNATVGRNAWNRLVKVLRENPALHRDQVEYWALLGEPIEDAFALTPLARELWDELYAQKSNPRRTL